MLTTPLSKSFSHLAPIIVLQITQNLGSDICAPMLLNKLKRLVAAISQGLQPSCENKRFRIDAETVSIEI